MCDGEETKGQRKSWGVLTIKPSDDRLLLVPLAHDDLDVGVRAGEGLEVVEDVGAGVG